MLARELLWTSGKRFGLLFTLGVGATSAKGTKSPAMIMQNGDEDKPTEGLIPAR
jgi:hypothetical protein